MASKREKAPDRRMRKIVLVICEGETEVRYINLLKTWYKSPIRIVSHLSDVRYGCTSIGEWTYIHKGDGRTGRGDANVHP